MAIDDILQSCMYDEFMELAKNGTLDSTTTMVKDLKDDSDTGDSYSRVPVNLPFFPLGRTVGKTKGELCRIRNCNIWRNKLK